MMPPDQPTPVRLFEMMHAYKLTGILKAGIELGVFDQLAAGPATAETVAARLGLDPRGARILLNALTANGLLEGAVPEGYQLAELPARFLVRDRAGYAGDMIKVIASTWEWEALSQLADSVRKGGPVAGENADTPGFGYWQDFAAYAHTVARPAAEALAGLLVPWAAGRPQVGVLDLACGHGLYGYTFAQRVPHARICSLDWPDVVDIALRHAQRLGIADRVEGVAGDMFTADLGGPYDLVLIT